MVSSPSTAAGSLRKWFRAKSIGEQIVVGLLTAAALSVVGAVGQAGWQAAFGRDPVTATLVTLYEPFQDGGDVAVRVSSTEPGRCFRDSSLSDRPEARRCFGEKSFVHDPCFAGTPLGRDERAVCPDDPWRRSAVVIEPIQDDLGLLGDPSAKSSVAPVDFRGPESLRDLGPGRSVWALELANGDRCTKIVGGTHMPLGGFAQSFDCQSGATVVGNLNEADAIWTANYFPRRSTESHLEQIRRVWL